MIKWLLIVSGCFFISSVALAQKPAGFLWYNVPKEEIKKNLHQGVPFSQLSYTTRDAVLRYYTLEALHKVRFTHRLEDERTFLAWQDFWLKEATFHGQLNQLALLQYPQYDYTVTHPTSSLGLRLYESIKQQKQEDIIHVLSKKAGLLFFYRGKQALDSAEVAIINDFCHSHRLTLLPVSVDGTRAEALPTTQLDKGQATQLGIDYFPAILLVNPRTKQTTPVSFGFITQDKLMERLLAVAPRFAGVTS